MRTFPAGGLMIPHRKGLTDGKGIENMPAPTTVVIPLHQHTGAPCEALVKPGDRVVRGQKIGDTGARISAPVHSSITGEVVAVEQRPAVHGTVVSVVIRRDGDDGCSASFGERSEILSPDEIIAAVREGGLVGLGGAAFPTHFKWAVPPDFPVDTVLVNGAECEPYVTVDHRLLVESSEQVLTGVRLAMRATGASRGVVAIESNKPDAIEAVRLAARGAEGIDVVVLGTKYPQGAEKMLIKAVLGREVPPRNLPFHVGVVVNNVQTMVAAAEAVLEGKALYEKVLTVSGGAVSNPCNARVPVGASLRDVLEFAGGVEGDFRLVIGGPMTGLAVEDLDLPVTKGMSAILALKPDEYASGEPEPCVRCARCVDACPMGLVPSALALYAERGDVEAVEKLFIEDCMECGACAFVCPARRPLVYWIKEGKQALAVSRTKAS